MLLASVVETSRRVAETSKRLEKIDLLATLLRQLDPEEVETVVAFLSGYTRQGRIGVGYAAIKAAAAEAAEIAALEVHEVDRALASLTAAKGHQKRAVLHSLLARATKPEQD